MDGANQEPTCWKPTATPGLYVRQPGGGFYARVALDGKRTWWSLKTTKLRKDAGLPRDLQAGFTRRLSTRSNSTRHAVIGAVMIFAPKAGSNQRVRRNDEGAKAGTDVVNNARVTVLAAGQK
jgi:hypothetical protein